MAVEEWVSEQDPDFFSSGLMALEHHWSKCITLEDNYIKKDVLPIPTGNKLGWLLIDSPSYLDTSVYFKLSCLTFYDIDSAWLR